MLELSRLFAMFGIGFSLLQEIAVLKPLIAGTEIIYPNVYGMIPFLYKLYITNEVSLAANSFVNTFKMFFGKGNILMTSAGLGILSPYACVGLGSIGCAALGLLMTFFKGKKAVKYFLFSALICYAMLPLSIYGSVKMALSAQESHKMIHEYLPAFMADYFSPKSGVITVEQAVKEGFKLYFALFKEFFTWGVLYSAATITCFAATRKKNDEHDEVN